MFDFDYDFYQKLMFSKRKVSPIPLFFIIHRLNKVILEEKCISDEVNVE